MGGYVDVRGVWIVAVVGVEEDEVELADRAEGRTEVCGREAGEVSLSGRNEIWMSKQVIRKAKVDAGGEGKTSAMIHVETRTSFGKRGIKEEEQMSQDEDEIST